MAFDEVDSVGVDDTVVSAPDSEVVGNQDDWTLGWGGNPGLSWATKSLASTSSVAASIAAATVVVSVSLLVVSVVSLHSNLNKAMG